MEARAWLMCAAYVAACSVVIYAAVKWAKAGDRIGREHQELEEHEGDDEDLLDPKGCNCNHCLHRRRKERDRRDEKGDPS